MSWLNLNQSLNSLKGQITSFATEVLSEGATEDTSESSSKTDVSYKELEEKCHNQELEIAAMRKLNHELEATLQSERLSRKNGVKDEEANWYWDPPPQQPLTRGTETNQNELQVKLLQDEISTLKVKLQEQQFSSDVNQELERLREENRNLTTNLEDLDNQHQLAMERLLTLKKELQKNFEVLKQEHEDLKVSNDEFVNERQTLLNKIGERDKEIEKIKTEKTEYETLHHKYLNLEKVHSMLKENAEKFQEENQDLHEEIFKLQEQLTKYEHEIEMSVKNFELSNMVPRENYEQLLKELNDLRDTKNSNQEHLEETNIDDNAKSVIEGLKREIRELKHVVSQKENDEIHTDHNFIKPEKIMHLYNKYVNFELPVDYIGEMPSSDDNIVLFKLESVFKTLNSFKKDIDALEHQLSEKNHNINHMQTQIEDMTAENDFLTTDLQQFETELNEMKKNNDFLINEIAALKNTSKLEPIIETHEENVAKLETELDTCHKKNKTFESEIKRIEKELSEVKNEKNSLQESLNELKNKYTTMLTEFETVKAETTAIEELEANNRTLESAKLKNVSDEIDELKKKLHAAVAKNEQLAIDIHILENDKVLLTKEVDDLKHTLSETTSSHNELEKLKYALDHKFEDVKEKLDEVIRTKNDLESQKIILSEKLETESNKNNSLQLELNKTSTEKIIISQKLEQLVKENVTLQETIDKLTTEVTTLMQVESDINNSSLKNSSQTECENTSALRDTIDELKAKILNQEKLNIEISNLKQEKQVLIETKLTLEAELASTDSKIAHLEQEFDKIISELNEKDSLIDKMNATISENSITIDNLNETVTDLNRTLEIKNEELQRLTLSLNDISLRSGRSNDELVRLSNEKEDLQKQIINLHETIQSRNYQISELNQQRDEIKILCNELKTTIDNKDKEIKELNQSIVELTDKMKLAENYSHLNDEYSHLVNEKETIEKEATELKNYLLTKEIELSDVKQRLENVEKSSLEYRNALDLASKEKADLINLINLKHNESIQYHNEIQRLNQVLLEQTNLFNKSIEEKDSLLSNMSNSCQNCENLRTTLKEKDEIIISLNQNATDYEKLKAELSQANDTIRSLQERCENLDRSMAIQLEAVKKLTAENVQLSELEQNSTKELERLRHHLVELEENYTQELMTSEQKLTECQARLHQVEERAKQTSTVYTSNSIRANQEVETLRNQIKLLEKQREDVQARLSEAEDARGRSEAALTNLQVVLEQFQLDKERDIQFATEKIRNKMEDVKRQNLSLQEEISRLNTKLEEALAGLQAASRLGDQVETKTAQINDLKEQVRTLHMSVAAAEERYYNATSNQQDKVDKNLVKNLVINYVMTAAQNTSNKFQVLRILSTVLDFNQKECEKLGLVRSSNVPDSLAAEFVKFLQNESKPRTPLPNMMGLTQSPSSRSTTPSSRKNSTLGPNPIIESGHTRNTSTGSNNLLFQNLDALETSSQLSIESDTTRRSDTTPVVRGTLDSGVTQPRDTEGAILKHVLRDM